MIPIAKSDDYQPIAWIGRYPVYVAAALTGLHVATMLLTTLLMSLGKTSILSHLMFSSAAVSGDFAFWQFITYAFFHVPSLRFVVEMFMLYSFGREVERFIGRRDFLALYAFLLILPPCALMAVGAFTPVQYSGSETLHFCIFLAFACLYPNIEMFFFIKAKWIAFCFLAIDLLQMLAFHAWVPLLVLVLSALTAFFFIGRLRYGFAFPGLQMVKECFVPRQLSRPSRKAPEHIRKEDLLVTVDSLLEKISKDGIASLTEKEREQLSRASEELQRRERRRP